MVTRRSTHSRHRIRTTRTGKKHPHKGHKMSAATRAKISASLKAWHRAHPHARRRRRRRHYRHHRHYHRRHYHLKHRRRSHRHRRRVHRHRAHVARRHHNRTFRHNGHRIKRQYHLLKREAYYRLRSGRRRSLNHRLHLKAGKPHTIRFRLQLRKRGTYWQDRSPRAGQSAMPRVI